jgi:hypothetical protein
MTKDRKPCPSSGDNSGMHSAGAATMRTAAETTRSATAQQDRVDQVDHDCEYRIIEVTKDIETLQWYV